MNQQYNKGALVPIRISRATGVAIIILMGASQVAAGAEKIDDPELAKLGAKIIATGWKSSWSPDGKQIAYGGLAAKGEDEVEGGVSIFDLNTGRTRELLKVGKDPAWSPGKGEFIAYAGGGYGAGEEIWIVKAEGGKPTKLVDGGYPSWSSDAKTLYFHSRKNRKLMKIDIGVEDSAPVAVMDMTWYYPMISPDDRHVAFRKGAEILVADLGSGEIVKRLPLQEGRGFLGGWSPDGRYISYGGYGAHDVIGFWLADLQTGKTTRLSAGNFTMSEWSRDGSKIAFDYRKSNTREVWMIETKALGKLIAKPPEPAPKVNPEQLPILIKQLGAADFKTRQAATQSLLKIGKPALASLKEAAKDEDVEVRTRAKKILEQIVTKNRFGE